MSHKLLQFNPKGIVILPNIELSVKLFENSPEKKLETSCIGNTLSCKIKLLKTSL